MSVIPCVSVQHGFQDGDRHSGEALTSRAAGSSLTRTPGALPPDSTAVPGSAPGVTLAVTGSRDPGLPPGTL